MPLTDPVPSSAFDVLERNIQDTDKFVNQEYGTFANRVGKNIKPIQVIEAEAIEIVRSLGWTPVGEFSTGFTYTKLNDVGRDTSGSWWRYNGSDLPKVITAGSVPSSPSFSVISFETAYNVQWEIGKSVGYVLDDLQGFTSNLYSETGIIDDGIPDTPLLSKRVQAIKKISENARNRVIDLADFIPATADKNYLADTEFQAALQYAKESGISTLFLPPSMVFKLSKTALNKNTIDKILITTGRPAVYDEESGGTIWTDDDRLFEVGIDDGNPDATGFTRSVYFYGVQMGRTANPNPALDDSDVAINAVNTAQFVMENCRTFGFKEGGTRLEGGLVIVKHIDTESYGLTGKDAAVGYGSGILMGQKYWGTFSLDIVRPHTFQYKHAITFARARMISVSYPIFENLQHSCYRFFGAEEIYSLSLHRTYSELVKELTLYSDSFTGLIYKLSVTNSEIHECPPFSPSLSNMDRSRVLRFSQSGNVFADASLDAQLGTTTIGRLVDSRFFVSGTLMDDQSYFDEITRMRSSLERKQKLLTDGTFSALSVTAPYGWSLFGTATAWTIESSPVNSGVSLKSGGGDWIHAQKGVVKDQAVKLYVIAITHKGEMTLKADGSTIYQATRTEWHTEIVRFQSAANATLLLQVGPISDINAKVDVAEVGLWEIGAADYTEVGATSGLLDDSIRAILREGYY